MGFDVLDTGFIGSLTTEEGGGGGGSCSTPNASYTGLAINQSTTTGCYRKPTLIATAVSHSLSSDTNLRFWVNCKLSDDTSSVFGSPACSDTGNDLVDGMLFTKTQLLAGISLLGYDSTNAAAQDASDDICTGWTINIAAVDIENCSTSICADSATSINACESVTYDGPVVYTYPSPSFPSFSNSSSLVSVQESTGSYDYELRIVAAMNYYVDSSSMGDDAISANSFKIHFQYDLTCDSSMPLCSSYTWIDGDETDSFLPAGDTGFMNGTTFIIDEADCWDVDYIAVRYRVEAMGSCGTSIFSDWIYPIVGVSVSSSYAGARCNGGPPPP